ncbi:MULTISPECIES: fatty acid desaturase domain-containing protein [Pseudomonas aeruginosa group]|uniref:fatty acid desaturase domain-containing protein n=1 Tax=Pseudomonas aeruginosa group TaxID=136841 RepID=UPI0000D72EB1
MLPDLAPFACLHMSLQHELIHGHPTRWPAFNALPGYLSLAAGIPARCIATATCATTSMTD